MTLFRSLHIKTEIVGGVQELQMYLLEIIIGLFCRIMLKADEIEKRPEATGHHTSSSFVSLYKITKCASRTDFKLKSDRNHRLKPNFTDLIL